MPIALYETLQALFASWNVVLPSKRYADSQAGNTDSWAQEVVDWMQEKCEDIIAIVKLPVATVQGALGWFYNVSEEQYYVTDSKGRQYRVTPEQKAFIEERYKTITNDGAIDNVSVQSLVSNMTNSITTTANPSQFGMQVSKELSALTRGISAIERTQVVDDWWTKIIQSPSQTVPYSPELYTEQCRFGLTYLGATKSSTLPVTSLPSFSLSTVARYLDTTEDNMEIKACCAMDPYWIRQFSGNQITAGACFIFMRKSDKFDDIVKSRQQVSYGEIQNIMSTNEAIQKGTPYCGVIVCYFYYYNSDLAQIMSNNIAFNAYNTITGGGIVETVMKTYDYSNIDIENRAQIDSKEAQDYATTGVIPDIVNTDDKERNLVIDPSAVDTGTWEQGAEKDATAETGANTIDKDATQTQTVTLTESITDAITNAIESIFENIGLFPDVNVDPEVAEGERAVQGLFTIWNPTEKQVAKLASYLWSSAFDDIIAQFKKWFSNPLDAIITLAYYPITPESTTTGEIKLGWFASGVTGVKKITTAKGELNCGKITIPKKYNNFLDFSPYTKVSLYLPFVGVVPLQADDIIGGSIEVIYRWEYLTGSCVAYVNVYNGLLNGKTMYQYSGNISMQIPLTGANYSNVYSGLVGGLGTAKAVLSKGGGIAGAVAGFAGSALNVKEDIQRTGSMSGNAGMLGNLTPYVIIERPLPDSPTTYNKLLGRESNSSVKIKDIKGYTECASVDLKNVRATAEEKAEIEKILLSGFYA